MEGATGKSFSKSALCFSRCSTYSLDCTPGRAPPPPTHTIPGTATSTLTPGVRVRDRQLYGKHHSSALVSSLNDWTIPTCSDLAAGSAFTVLRVSNLGHGGKASMLPHCLFFLEPVSAGRSDVARQSSRACSGKVVGALEGPMQIWHGPAE